MHGLRGCPEVSRDRLSVTLVGTADLSAGLLPPVVRQARSRSYGLSPGMPLGAVGWETCLERGHLGTLHLGSVRLVGVSAPFISTLHVNGSSELVLFQGLQWGSFCSCLSFWCSSLSHTADLLVFLVLYLFVLFPAEYSLLSLPRTVW